MTAAPSITRIDFPTTIDTSNGPVQIRLTANVLLGEKGNAVEEIMVALSNTHSGWSFSNGSIIDAFKDSTPQSGVSLITFDGTTPPGLYAIDRISIWDTTGATTIYTHDQLAALGWPTSYTIVNTKAPPAPTLSVNTIVNGLIEGNQAVLKGTGQVNDLINVSGVLQKTVDNAVQDRTVDLGSVKVAADGTWTFNTAALADGHYTNVMATQLDASGNSSANTLPTEFYVFPSGPAAPTLQTHVDTSGTISSARPFVSGFGQAGSTITIYDGQLVVAHTTVDSGGWYGTTVAALASGSHNLIATASDAFHRTSPISTVLALQIAATQEAGIQFKIASFTNTTAVKLDTAIVQNLLDDVGAILSSLLGGSTIIELSASVEETPVGKSWATAAAGAAPAVFDGAAAMPIINGAGLQISTTMAKDLMLHPDATRSYVDVLAHEMLHVLGFNSIFELPDIGAKPYQFGTLTSRTGANLFFNGQYASAMNGGPVPLANTSHLNASDDLMYYSSPVKFDDVTFFGKDSKTTPLSQLDLAILKDLGYQIKDPLLAPSGHLFIAGAGTIGHDTVDGTSGIDTLFINRKASDFAITAGASTFSVQDTVANEGTEHLNNIERIRFADSMVAIDVAKGQNSGEAYRLYQAAFNRTPDQSGLGFWIKQMDLGTTLLSVANAFVASDEFHGLYGANVSDKGYVELLYANVLHRQPDQDGANFWINALQHGISRAELLASFSESNENIAQLVGVIGNGFQFHEYTG